MKDNKAKRVFVLCGSVHAALDMLTLISIRSLQQDLIKCVYPVCPYGLNTVHGHNPWHSDDQAYSWKYNEIYDFA